MQTNSIPPTQDERIMAALSHGAILLPFTGAIVPIVVWITQKDKSPYIAFQSLQALVYHGILILGWFIGMACYIASFITPFLGMAVAGSGGDDAFGLFPLIPFGVFGLILCSGAVFLAYGLIAAILCLQGKDFRYLLIGDVLSRRLQESKA